MENPVQERPRGNTGSAAKQMRQTLKEGGMGLE